MATDYRLNVRTSQGVLLAQCTDFLWLQYQLRLNAPGSVSFILPAEHALVPQLAQNCIVEVWRHVIGSGDWYCDAYGLVRKAVHAWDDNQGFLATYTCPGPLSLLGWRYVLWPAGIANRSEFSNQPGETVLKRLVEYNCGPAALAASGRLRNGAFAGLTVAEDLGRGYKLDKACAWRKVLDVVQELAPLTGGDFDIVAGDTPGAWVFEWFPGQRGSDRTNTLAFSLAQGNMSKPVYTVDQSAEATVAIAAGQGEGEDRSTAIAVSSIWSADNDIETFADARNETTAAGLEDVADKALMASRALRTLAFSVTQTPACHYGVDYFLGDLVTARYLDFQLQRKIRSIQVECQGGTGGAAGTETIAVEVGNIP